MTGTQTRAVARNIRTQDESSSYVSLAEAAAIAARQLTRELFDVEEPESEKVPDRPVMVNLEDLRHLFDLAVDSPLMCSGRFESDDVDLIRRVCTMIGVDPETQTPDEFIRDYPHRFQRRKVFVRRQEETQKMFAAREAEERAEVDADHTCQAGTYDRRCGLLADDPKHAPQDGDCGVAPVGRPHRCATCGGWFATEHAVRAHSHAQSPDHVAHAGWPHDRYGPAPTPGACGETTPQGPCGLQSGHSVGPMLPGYSGHMGPDKA